MQNLNSDQLRRQLDENNAAMNTLADNNQKIVELLGRRGLQAVDPAGDDISIHPSIMQLDKPQSEPKPLTVEELKAGGWWCADVSKDCAKAFVSKGFSVFNLDGWGNAERWDCCIMDDTGFGLITKSFADNFASYKQIHRIGNNFYWGAHEKT